MEVFVEQHWRNAAVRLGRHWKAVLAAALAVTVLLAVGMSQIEFATGQDSYLNPDSQAAIDNVEFQTAFGGETLILLFTADEGHDITDLFAGENLEELRRIEAELRSIPETYAVITPLTSVGFSEALVQNGVGTSALLSALEREPTAEGEAARSADITVTLARLGAAGEEEFTNPDWVEFLIFGNEGFDESGAPPAPEDRVVRKSLASTFPSQQIAVGGVLLSGNADLDQLSSGTEQVLGVMDGADFDGFSVITTGSPVFLKDINDYLQGGMLTLGALAVGVMAVVLLLLFRVRWRLLPLAVVLVGVLWGFSLLGFLGIDLSLVTISGLPILIGLGIDFAIQVHNRVEEEVVLDSEAHPMAETLANLGPALVVATISGILAFLALQISRVPMIRDFGVMLAIGIGMLLVAGIVLTTAVLGIREWTRPTEERGRSAVERFVVWLGGLPQGTVVPIIVASAALFVAGVALEGNLEIESDPLRWINQESQTVEDIETLEERTGFSSTLGVLVQANNTLADPVAQVVHEFTLDAEARPEVVTTSSLVNTLAKIIAVDGATPLPPTSADLAAAAEVMPDDIARVLLSPDRTATQVNLRLAPASLDERAVLVERLESDLQGRIDALDLPADSILLAGLPAGTEPVRAVPAGLAIVGVGLLENLSANRAILTYLGLVIVGLWLLVRHRSVARALIIMVPVLLAVGTSSVVVGAFGLTLSPLTTVSGPLVIASCTEFSVLILARYLEERQSGFTARDATDHASARTGRAFFTSAATTIGGFAVLIGSALPLLSDFGLIVTLNVAIALLSALVVMPPLMVWADGKGLIAPGTDGPNRSVRLAAPFTGRSAVATVVAVIALLAAGGALYAAAETDDGEPVDTPYEPVELVVATAPPPGDEPAPVDDVDPSDYGTTRPDGLVAGVLFDVLTREGADPQNAVCTTEVLLGRISEPELLALGLAEFAPEALEPVREAAADCQVPDEVVAAAIENGI